MERTVQLMDQTVLMGTMVQTSGVRTRSGDTADFGSMVRQKAQDARGQDAQKVQKKDQGGSQKDQGAQKKDTKAPKDTADEAAEDQGPGTEQYVIAAALMLQLDVPVLTEEVQTGEGDEDTGPVMLSEAVVDIGPMEEALVSDEDVGPEETVVSRTVVEDAPVTYQDVERTVVRTEEARSGASEEEDTEEEVQVEETVTDAPVFADVEAAPVKVAAPKTEAPIPLESRQGVEELTARIRDLIVDTGEETRVEFTLIPASLGKISVEIVRGSDGALHVQLSATTMRAAELLQRHSTGLENALAGSDRSQVKVDVTASEETQRQFLDPNADSRQEQQRRQQEQQGRRQRRPEPHEAQDFVSQLRLGLVGLDG